MNTLAQVVELLELTPSIVEDETLVNKLGTTFLHYKDGEYVTYTRAQKVLLNDGYCIIEVLA